MKNIGTFEINHAFEVLIHVIENIIIIVEIIIKVVEYVAPVFEVVIIVLIFVELVELEKNRSSLEQHSQALDKSRPLYPTLYTNGAEILNLAVDFIRNSNVCYAFGTIESLLITERGCEEDTSDYQNRTEEMVTYEIDYIKETENFILSGKEYYRIMNFLPSTHEQDNLIVLSNIRYFKRLFEFKGSRKLALNIYHNPEIPIIAGDFHFRCSDSQVIIRAGGHRNTYTNNAIVITDSRVVKEYKLYYNSVIDSDKTKMIDLSILTKLEKCYESDKKNKINQIINELYTT